MRTARAAGVFLVSLALSGCIGIGGGFPGGNAYRESVDVTRPLSANGELALENTNGSVHVATWTRRACASRRRRPRRRRKRCARSRCSSRARAIA